MLNQLAQKWIAVKKHNRQQLIRETHFLPLNGISGKLTCLAFNWTLRKQMYEFMASRLENSISSLLGVIEDFYIRTYEDGKIPQARIIGHVRHGVFGGTAFSDCMRPFIPESEYVILKMGENEARFNEVLRRIIDTNDRIATLKGRIASSMVGPLMMLSIFYALMYIIGNQVGPAIGSVVSQEHLPDAQIPFVVRALLSAGNFFTSIWCLLPWFIILVSIPVYLYLGPRWTGPWRVLADRVFPFSYYKDFQGYQWFNSFLAMMIAGSSDMTILDRQYKMADAWLGERLLAIQKAMSNGRSMVEGMIGDRVAYYFPNKEIIYDVNSVAGSSNFPERMAVLLGKWSIQYEKRIEKISKVIAFIINMLMYTGLILVAVGTNALSSMISHVQ